MTDRRVEVAEGAVAVVASGSQRQISARIAAGLRERGFAAREQWPSQSDRGIVVVLSADLLAAWEPLPLPTEYPDARLASIWVGQVDAALVPESLSELNGIRWDDGEVDAILDDVAAALRTELAEYRRFVSLQARAEGWVASGRDPKDLAGTTRQLSTMRAELAAVDPERLTSPDVLEYVQASLAAVRANRIRVWLGRALMVLLSGLLVTTGTTAWGVYQTVHSEIQLLMITTGIYSTSSPEVQAVKAAGLIQLQLDNHETVHPALSEYLVGLWSMPWPAVRFSKAGSAFVRAIAIRNDGSMLWAGGTGEVWRSDHMARKPARIASTGLTLTPLLSASSDQRTWAVGGQDAVFVHTESSDTTLTVPSVTALTVAVDGQWLAAMSAEGVRTWTLESGPPAELPAVTGAPLTMGVVRGRPAALLRTARGVELRDLVGAASLGSWTVELDEFAEAAIGPDGQIAVTGRDRRVWRASGGTLEPTGIAVPPRVDSMAITPGGLLMVTPMGGPTGVWDLNTGGARGEVCREGTAQGLSTSPDGAWVACAYVTTNAVWSLAGASPDGAPTELPAPQVVRGDTEARLEGGDLLAGAGVPATPCRVLDEPGRRERPATPGVLIRGAVTAVDLSATGEAVAYGSRTGEVVVADVSGACDLRLATRWASPDGATVTAVRFSGTELTVGTTTATWKVPVCTGCGRDPARLVEAIRARLLPCYASGLDQVVPGRTLDALGVRTCQE